MELKEPIATVVRVTRPDTLIVRIMVPQLQSMVSTYLVLEGVECGPEAKSAINEWVEHHSNGEWCKLIAARDYFRDSYGRLLGDLADMRTGEVLTDYLIDVGVADARPQHFLDLVREMLTSEGPET